MATETTTSVDEELAVAALARSVLPAQRTLLRKYLLNALSSPKRRSVPAHNAKFSELTSAPASLALIRAAGFVASESADGAHYVVTDGDEADEQLRSVLSAIDAATPCLLDLPHELLLSNILGELSAEDLSALQRVAASGGDDPGRDVLIVNDQRGIEINLGQFFDHEIAIHQRRTATAVF